MATTTTVKAPKTPKAPVAFAARVIEQLTRAALTKKISVEELASIETHIGKLRAILS
jgi:hypothetical protein